MAERRLGKYRLLTPIAQGGMAEIFLATHEGPGGFEREVVIKRVHAHLAHDPQLLTMFLDEARLAARLSHPNIVQVTDFGEVDGTYFLCMERLEGADLNTILRAYMKRKALLPVPLVAVIASAVCDGLHYAHSLTDKEGKPLGIVHRDLSPSNIFLTTQGAVKLLDFGIAKTRDRQARTEVGQLKGKIIYMSPEQARGDPVDARSDLFSVGTVLYEMLTGVRLFARKELLASLVAVVSQPMAPPSSKRPEIPPALDAVVMRALQREREQRFQTADELRQALDAYLTTVASVSPVARVQGFMLEFKREQGGQLPPPVRDPGTPQTPKPNTRAETVLPVLQGKIEEQPPLEPTPSSGAARPAEGGQAGTGVVLKGKLVEPPGKDTVDEPPKSEAQPDEEPEPPAEGTVVGYAPSDETVIRAQPIEPPDNGASDRTVMRARPEEPPEEGTVLRTVPVEPPDEATVMRSRALDPSEEGTVMRTRSFEPPSGEVLLGSLAMEPPDEGAVLRTQRVEPPSGEVLLGSRAVEPPQEGAVLRTQRVEPPDEEAEDAARARRPTAPVGSAAAGKAPPRLPEGDHAIAWLRQVAEGGDAAPPEPAQTALSGEAASSRPKQESPAGGAAIAKPRQGPPLWEATPSKKHAVPSRDAAVSRPRRSGEVAPPRSQPESSRELTVEMAPVLAPEGPTETAPRGRAAPRSLWRKVLIGGALFVVALVLVYALLLVLTTE